MNTVLNLFRCKQGASESVELFTVVQSACTPDSRLVYVSPVRVEKLGSFSGGLLIVRRNLGNFLPRFLVIFPRPPSCL